MAELKTIIQLRNATSEQWGTEAGQATPLMPGEGAVEVLPNGKVKLKFGTSNSSNFGNSAYFGGADAQIYQSETLSSDNETGDIAVIESLIPEGAEVNAGDMAIVKRYLSGNSGAVSYTSYVYDPTVAGDIKWVAMDGNYSASNVFLKGDITLAGDYEAIGNYKKGDTIAAGTSLESLFSGLLQQELEPAQTATPTASIAASGGNGEVGTTYTVPTATLTINGVGSYTYGPATGITFAIGDVRLAEGADPATATNYKDSTEVMDTGDKMTLKANGNTAYYEDTAKTYTFSASADYTVPAEGSVPVTNLGNARPGVKFSDGSVTIADKTATFSGWRRVFGGGTTAATIDSAAIRNLAQLKKSNESVPTAAGGKGIIFRAAKGATKVVFAYPSSWTTKTPKFEIFTMAWGATEGFVKSTVQVADARGGTNGLKEYTVYTYTPATPLAADLTEYCVYFA